MNKNTAQAKGVRTFIQAVPGFIIGLFAAVWAVPGVPTAIQHYLFSQGAILLGTIGLFGAAATGVISYAQNKVEDR